MQNARFGSVDSQFLRKSHGKRSFWKVWILSFCESPGKAFVLEVWSFSFCECPVKNARVGSVDCQFLRMSRGKRSFWNFGSSVFAKVSWKTLVVEVWALSFCESLVQNARFETVDSQFLRKSRGKRSF